MSMFPNVDLMHEGDTYKLGFAGGGLTRPLNPKLRNSEPRQIWMQEQGIDVKSMADGSIVLATSCRPMRVSPGADF